MTSEKRITTAAAARLSTTPTTTGRTTAYSNPSPCTIHTPTRKQYPTPTEIDPRTLGWGQKNPHLWAQHVDRAIFNVGREPGPVRESDAHGNRRHNTVFNQTQIMQVAIPARTRRKKFSSPRKLRAAARRTTAAASQSSSAAASNDTATSDEPQDLSRNSVPNPNVENGSN